MKITAVVFVSVIIMAITLAEARAQGPQFNVVKPQPTQTSIPHNNKPDFHKNNIVERTKSVEVYKNPNEITAHLPTKSGVTVKKIGPMIECEKASSPIPGDEKNVVLYIDGSTRFTFIANNCNDVGQYGSAILSNPDPIDCTGISDEECDNLISGKPTASCRVLRGTHESGEITYKGACEFPEGYTFDDAEGSANKNIMITMKNLNGDIIKSVFDLQ